MLVRNRRTIQRAQLFCNATQRTVNDAKSLSASPQKWAFFCPGVVDNLVNLSTSNEMMWLQYENTTTYCSRTSREVRELKRRL